MIKNVSVFVSRLLPFRIKAKFFDLWKETDDEFWLYSKTTAKSYPDNLFRNRFLWKDLDDPITKIKENYSDDPDFIVLSDRTDAPSTLSKHTVSLEDFKKVNITKGTPIICAFNSDEKLLHALKIISKNQLVNYFSPSRYTPTSQYFDKNDVAKETLKEDLALERGKFDLQDFENIIQAIDITKKLNGDYVEIGVFKGDSAHLALNYMKKIGLNRRAYFFDLFEGFTNESSKGSQDSIWLNTHADTSLEYVKNYLNGFSNYELDKLDIVTERLPNKIEKIAICNIDVDIYEAVKSALEKVAPFIVKNGVIIIEDQGHTPLLAGALLATQEFLESSLAKDFVPIHLSSGQMFLIKTT